MIRHGLAIIAYMIVTFALQGGSHFVLNRDHFAQLTYLRETPIFALGFASMIVQALVISVALQVWKPRGATIADGIKVSAAFGVMLASYIVLAEPAKYLVPSISQWMTIELAVAAMQFSLFGVLLGLIHRRFGNRHDSRADS